MEALDLEGCWDAQGMLEAFFPGCTWGDDVVLAEMTASQNGRTACAPAAGPELTLNSAPWQGGLAEHCPVIASIPAQHPSPSTASISQHSIHSLAEHPSPCKASVLVLCARSHCPCWCQPTKLCRAVPCWTTASLLPTSAPSSTRPRSCRGFDHLYSRCSSRCPHHRILEMSPMDTGTTGEPESLREG